MNGVVIPMNLRKTSSVVFLPLFLVSGLAATPKASSTKAAAKPAVAASVLYVQAASSGTLTPIDEKGRRYRLLLDGVDPKVIFFSDRPARAAGRVSMKDFIDRVGFGRESAPNAAIEIAGGKSDSDVIVVELSKPAYDAASRSLSYEVRILEKARDTLAFWSTRMDKRIPAQFGEVTLFIDNASCSNNCKPQFDCCPGYCCDREHPTWVCSLLDSGS